MMQRLEKLENEKAFWGWITKAMCSKKSLFCTHSACIPVPVRIGVGMNIKTKIYIIVYYDQQEMTKLLDCLVTILQRPYSSGPLTDDSSVNFHDMFFFIFCQIIAKNEEKHIMEIYGWVVCNFPVVHKWTRWIRS